MILVTFLTIVAALNVFLFIDDLLTPAMAMSRIPILAGFIIWLVTSAIIGAVSYHVIFHGTVVHLILLPLAVYPAFMRVVLYFAKD